MKYRIKKETKPKLPTYGKYKAVAVHEQTITSEQIIQEAAKLHILSEVKGYYWSSTLHSTERSG
ncbi:MAG: hypothetical protein K6A96_15820 [Prevotella sp.]|nr:hypothetical protein [Prevotella sp.]